MMIYRSLIRSEIDYGSIVYNSDSSRELVSLESVSNEAMRISSGCFKSTPLSSLQVITEEPPFQIRRDKLSLKYYYKVKSLPQNPAFKLITPEQEALYANKNSPPPFAIRIQKLHTKLNLENKRVMPDFSYSRLDIKEPTWGLPSTRLNLSLTDLPKEKTPTMAYQKRFKEVVENKYKGWNHIYTDGSKSEIGVEAAATIGNRTKSDHYKNLALYSQQKHMLYT